MAAERREVCPQSPNQRSWREVAGIWPEADDLEAAIEEGRMRSDERRDSIGEELFRK